MDPILISKLIPLLAEGVKAGIDIVERLSKGDADAVEQAKDWLGITGDVESAIAAWEASKQAD